MMEKKRIHKSCRANPPNKNRSVITDQSCLPCYHGCFFPQMDAFVHDQLQIMKCYNTITARRHHLINSTAISTSVAIVDSTITKEKWMEDTFIIQLHSWQFSFTYNDDSWDSEIDSTCPIRLAVTRLISNRVNQVWCSKLYTSREPWLLKIDGSMLYTSSRREPWLIKTDGRVHSGCNVSMPARGFEHISSDFTGQNNSDPMYWNKDQVWCSSNLIQWIEMQLAIR